MYIHWAPETTWLGVLTSLTVNNLSVTAVVSPHMQIPNLRMKILLTLEIHGSVSKTRG